MSEEQGTRSGAQRARLDLFKRASLGFRNEGQDEDGSGEADDAVREEGS